MVRKTYFESTLEMIYGREIPTQRWSHRCDWTTAFTACQGASR